MNIFLIIVAVVIGLLGVKLLLAGIKAGILFLKAENISLAAKQMAIRDFTLGVLFIILAIAILT